MNNVRLVNDELQEEGQRLLDKTKLISVLRQYGDVHIGGSFVYGTMVDRDIDITVTVQSQKEINSSLRSKICKDLTALEGCTGFKMLDRKENPKEGRPQGIWLSPQFILDGTWFLDIWVIANGETASTHIGDIDSIMRDITEQQRTLILEIKTEVFRCGLKSKGVSSVQIYKDVLRNKVQSPDEWMRLNKESMDEKTTRS
jgi:hypothetical protein